MDDLTIDIIRKHLSEESFGELYNKYRIGGINIGFNIFCYLNTSGCSLSLYFYKDNRLRFVMSPNTFSWVIDEGRFQFRSTLPESEFLALTKDQQSFVIKNIDIFTGKNKTD